jgi:hypothetical protein
LIKGIKLNAICDKRGSLLDLELAPTNTDDRIDAAPMLPRLTEVRFQGDLLGDSGYKGIPFAQATLDHDIHASVSPGRTRDGQFLPIGVWWVVWASVHLAVPLPPPQHRLRSKARPLRCPHLDHHDLHHLSADRLHRDPAITRRLTRVQVLTKVRHCIWLHERIAGLMLVFSLTHA